MATILCLETSTTNCSVALSVNGSVIALKEDKSAGYSHAEKLHLFISEVLSESGIAKGELDAIAVSKGPGSYTGLRIGVSAAKGLCFALEVPLIAVPTLEVLVQKVTGAHDFIVPMLDARRMEVYSAVFNGNKEQIRPTKAEILTVESFSDYLMNGSVVFIGDGVAKFRELNPERKGIYVEDELPSAADMALLASSKYKISDIEDVAYFEPYYLKDFISG